MRSHPESWIVDRSRLEGRRRGLGGSAGGALGIAVWLVLWLWLVVALVAPAGFAPADGADTSIALSRGPGSRQ